MSSNTNADLRPLVDAAHTLAELARREDLGAHGDISTRLIDADQSAEFVLLAKQAGVFCGRAIVEPVLRAFDADLNVSWLDGAEDGRTLTQERTELAIVRGSLSAILAVERTLLNFVQRTSGVATLTRRYVEAVGGTRAKIYDTRKTIPGWRLLDKYAVRCGGGHNHRTGLYDAVLLKDNHLAGIETPRLAGRVFEMLSGISGLEPQPAFVEVEAASLAQAEQLFRVVGIDIVLLDNFALDELHAAVKLRDSLGLAGKVEFEASGGVNLDSVRSIAETGVDRISVGALTHSAPALDLSLKRIT